MSVDGTDSYRVRNRVHFLDAVVLGDQAAPLAALARGIAEPGEAFAASPVVHVVEKFAALLGRVRRGDRTHDAAAFDDLREQAESRVLVLLADDRNQQRLA